ncbi:MAG: hypothetical protein KIH89_000180 [Candidatus Shapirobacteria bacterium]|nr:hypothetical protein [Candidatus Shapirobacteria bacterium]
MEGNSFWLIYIQDDQVCVSLISQENKTFRVVSIGPQKPWDSFSSDILVKSIDESLSVASLNANITEDQEPAQAAFVVPPFWVSNDGKIMPSKLKFIKDICKELSLTPTGFLAEDESLVEESNKTDGFPASFILLHLSKQEFYLSLVYLGHIKERIKKGFDGEFTGQILESAILELKTDSTLPPQIIIFGDATPETISSLKNFPWVGKKNIETFLHFPDIKLYSSNDLITTFTKIISNQINPTKNQINKTPDLIEDDIDPNLEKTEIKENIVEATEIVPDTNEVEEEILKEVLPEDLGFSIPNQPLPIITADQLPPSLDISPEPNLDPFQPPVITPPILPGESLEKKKIVFKFPRLKFSKLKVNYNIFWIILAILPFLAIAPLFLISAKITLFTTPYQFDKSVPITLKIDATPADISKSIIPVQKETIQVNASATVETTGQKTVGDKAKGEIIIFNKLDKTQNIPKGSILTDSSGKKFELPTAVSVNASSSDLEKGVITLGQTKTVILASDIGSEFNLAADVKLTFKDFPETNIIAKTDSAFTGGSKQQIRAVSQADKTAVQSKIDEEIAKNIDNQINQKVGNISGVIKGTIQSQKDNLELSREIGEAADELKATVNATVSVFLLPDSVKDQIIKHFLSSESDFNNIEYQSGNFNLSFNITKTELSQAVGTLNLSGKSLPKVNIPQIQKSLVAKTNNQAGDIIKKLVPRAYNFHLTNSLPLLPFKSDNINIEIKTETL